MSELGGKDASKKSLNSGPLPGGDIDCRVQRTALALRYHYSSIDRPALKSKSHLVAQAIVSESGAWDVCLRSGGEELGRDTFTKGEKNASSFSRLLFNSPCHLFLQLFFFFPTDTFMDKCPTWSDSQCFMCWSTWPWSGLTVSGATLLEIQLQVSFKGMQTSVYSLNVNFPII